MREKNDKELIKKVIDLSLVNNIQEIELYINSLKIKINFYQTHLQHLKDTKPLFFQKNKLRKHNKEIEECENKIRDTYIKLEHEIDEIEKIKREIFSR